MNRNTLYGILILAALLMFIPFGQAGAVISTQCPDDTDGIDTDGDGIVDNDNLCIHVTASDGFVNMANDGRRLMYIFSYHAVDPAIEPNGPNFADEVMVDGTMAAELPAPTIIVKQGQKLYLTLTNVGMLHRGDLFDAHTIHWHGFQEASSTFDGIPQNSFGVIMGASLTYFYNVVVPGTYAWHCHVEATEHMQMGMLANLYVLPIQNNKPNGFDLNGFTHVTGNKYVYNDGDGSTIYDVEYPIQIQDFDSEFHDASFYVQPLPFAMMDDNYPMFNGRGYPDTVNQAVLLNTADDEGYPVHSAQPISSLIEATVGQKILLRISSMSTTSFHALTVLGIPMRVVGKDSELLRGPGLDGKDLSYWTNSVDVGGGETFDVILDTTGIAVGKYYLYSTNLNDLSNDDEDFGGLMTEIVIRNP